MNLGIGEQNVVILTTPRTGSTALCRRLSDDLNLVYYNEAFHPEHYTAKNLWKDFYNGTKIICKVFPDHKITEEELDELCKDSFVIFLDRDDLVEQIASYHSLAVTNRPWFAKTEEPQPYTVDTDNSKIAYSIKQILSLRQSAEIYKQRADVSLTYEDILDSIENDHIRRYDRPDNYDELVSRIKKLLPIFLR